MITLTINSVPVLFIKAFTSLDVATIMDFVRKAAEAHPGTGSDVLFIATPITPATVEAVTRLQSENFRVIFRDHHGIDGEPRNDREKQVAAATAKLNKLLGDDCRITVRRLHPACSTLVEAGEFSTAAAIIADPDPDGLTAAMKAAGISYPDLDCDAVKLDGEPQFQVTGSPLSQLLAKGMAVIPSYDPLNPRARQEAHQKLFSDWVKAVEGDAAATQRLWQGCLDYDQAKAVSQALSKTATALTPGVFMVDVTKESLYDPGTLNALLEERPNCRITILRKSLGPIAAVHGIQYSLSVTRRYQDSVNLFDLVPTDVRTGPQAGVISNVSFLLHTSEEIFNQHVLPALLSKTLDS